MTDKEKLNRVIAEIKRLQQKVINGATSGQYSSETIREKNQLLVSLISFIDSMQEEPTIPDIVDEHYWEMLGEEPVSEDMWEASKQYALRQVLASTDAEMTEQAYLSLKLFSGFEIAVAHKDGANWQKEQDKQWLAEEHKHIFAKGRDSMKQQIMKNVKDGVITFDYYGDNDKIYGCIAHDSFSLEELRLKDGDKVKLIIIKEE